MIRGVSQAEVYHISKKEFDHGRTRARGAEKADSEFLIYFTQDAVPADERTVENLLRPFRDPEIGAVYGRQLPDKNCRLIERYTRSFNYPEKSMKKTGRIFLSLGSKHFSALMYVQHTGKVFMKKWEDLYTRQFLMRI